jgi:pimeloyl-ACP methyl ester carboxylesterase
MTPQSASDPLDLSEAAQQLPMEAYAYALDAIERWVLFLDVKQQRTAASKEQSAKTVPHVLKFQFELVMDGRQLPRPVNYALVRVAPPTGVKTDPRKRPFVVVDPRAGHGPGIGGFKADSEIGVIFKAGHPCYFIGFTPEPLPGQTIEDVVAANAAFIERVSSLHQDADGRPAVIGNCQAGWAIMMAAALRPELFGPLIVAGSPLSYWAGVRGEHPMRYSGGLLGGSWLTALMSDLGKGKFDGAWLVSNFESLNPANTYWTKHYRLYANVDKEAPRYLEFEEWWGAHTLLNEEEIQFIVDELFIGDKLASGDVVFSDGKQVDLRNIRSPIVIFCSKADNITPPSQALGWLLDLYDTVDDIRAQGQTIVYAVHESAGHLGIFVSGAVAKKEHQEFASNIDMIDVLPPGLYEAVMTPKDAAAASADLISGDYLVRFEARSLDDIRALGGNSIEDDRRFAATERISQINLGLYRSLVQPWIRLWINEGNADWLRRMHPLRMTLEAFSSSNPFLPSLGRAAEGIRDKRHQVDRKNAFWKAQETASRQIETSLDAFRDARDSLLEMTFHSIYGSPLVQAITGLSATGRSPRKRPGQDALRRALVWLRSEELRAGLREGGPREAAVRAGLYIRMPEGVADERGFRLLQQMREEAGAGLDLGEFKRMVRDQFFTLMIDERAAIDAIPEMMARNPELAIRMETALRRLFEAVAIQGEGGKARRIEIERLFKSAAEARSSERTATEKKSRNAAREAAPAIAASSGEGRR